MCGIDRTLPGDGYFQALFRPPGTAVPKAPQTGGGFPAFRHETRVEGQNLVVMRRHYGPDHHHIQSLSLIHI